MLCHGVQCATVVEPLNLGLVESVSEACLPRLSVLWVDSERYRLTHSELSAHEVDFVIGVDLVVVCWVVESQRKHALLLQVGFVLSQG